jgi:uncharacterized membrane protein YhaH (DUF805 family)
MDFTTAARKCLLDKYADFEGRASRPEFWWFVLFCFVVNIVGGVIFRSWINALISLALLVPTIAAGSRRLHDTGKSGWLQLLCLIPVVGWLIVIYLMVQRGEAGTNRYGPATGDEIPPVEIVAGQ